MTEFETVDIDDNICQFQYVKELNDLDNEVTFKVYSIPLNEMRWFSYRVKIINEDLIKSEHLSINYNTEFSKKGIPEKIIEIASSELNSNIQSSPISFQNGNYLTEPSRKAWERLVARNENAVLDSENDCFIYKLTD
ncbi:MAG: hypothetical protein COZ18_02455 [Flexibacter sp. CG_4_10_14_3_um_filter_32_15]|nr:MAG: hypothetical protein COZ18_02455 [Flexibacter sp. CG_4_10_14_3_um_filter_32_15]PJB17329.1 MAG: hypothetical protein CO117_12060 [Flavobacteriaceae bacterium CG_4_9_14_3_um_filter_33_16]